MNVKKVQPRNSANVTQEVIEAWKKEYPRGIWEMVVENDEKVIGTKKEPDGKGGQKEEPIFETRTGYFRKPSRQELGATATIQNDPMMIAEDLLRTCWLGGDEELLEDDDYFQGAITQFQELMKVRKGEIKKL